jgi:RNA polymerase sigma factor (sigma-70 family)
MLVGAAAAGEGDINFRRNFFCHRLSLFGPLKPAMIPLPEDMLDVISDSELVAAAVAGDRDAFARIVERYQRLLCSIAYSAIGSVSASEDVAQETFITAWRELASLREPEKLRSWLCGILRHQVNRHWRRAGRDPMWRADNLDEAADVSAPEEPVADIAMQKEEQDLLRQALARVPPLYREPMVLYYRESRSIEHVAAALDLTEDAVKQRLSRGRKMIQEQVLSLVEGALARTGPGKLFTAGVLAGLAQLATPTKVAAAGVVAAQGSAMAKTTSLAAFVGGFSGLYSSLLGLRAGLDQSRTPRERRVVVKTVIVSFGSAMVFLFLLWILRGFATTNGEQRALWAAVAQAWVIATGLAWWGGARGLLKYLRKLRGEERQAHPECFLHPADAVGSSTGEFKSRATLWGVPLVHVRFASPEPGSPPVVGWIAAGDRAYGLILAWGLFAVAPVSVGAVAVGIFSVGSLGLGVVTIGTLAVGALAVGCAAIGVKALAWLSALGWQSAQSGGFAIARVAAEGPLAFATHANDPVARQLLGHPQAEQHVMIFLIVAALFTLVPVTLYAREVRRRMRR